MASLGHMAKRSTAAIYLVLYKTDRKSYVRAFGREKGQNQPSSWNDNGISWFQQNVILCILPREDVLIANFYGYLFLIFMAAS